MVQKACYLAIIWSAADIKKKKKKLIKKCQWYTWEKTTNILRCLTLPLLQELLFQISSMDSFICTILHRQDSTYHGLQYTSHGVLAGMRNSTVDRSDNPSLHKQTLYHRATSRSLTGRRSSLWRQEKPTCNCWYTNLAHSSQRWFTSCL